MNNETGRSMIEMLGVLAIIGMLSVGGIAGYSKAMDKFKLNKTIYQITTIANNIRTLYMSQKSYYGIWETSVKEIVIPDDIKAEYGMEFSLNAGDFDGYYAAGFYVELSNVPNRVCAALVSYDWSSIGCDVILLPNYGYTKTPISPAIAIEGCNDEYDVNEIDIYFDVDHNLDFYQNAL